MRPSFVEKVSTQMINQLLDDILVDGIVNDGEKDSILEENNIRGDKARRLIDMVRRKGDKACRKMIAHLERRDPELYAELGLASGQPAPSGELTFSSWKAPNLIEKHKVHHLIKFDLIFLLPAAEPQTEPQQATSLLPTIETFWREKQSDKQVS